MIINHASQFPIMKRKDREQVYFSLLGKKKNENDQNAIKKKRKYVKHKTRRMVVDEDSFHFQDETAVEFDFDQVKSMVLTQDNLETYDDDCTGMSDNLLNVTAKEAKKMEAVVKNLLCDVDIRPVRLRSPPIVESCNSNKLMYLIKYLCKSSPSDRLPIVQRIRRKHVYLDFLNLPYARDDGGVKNNCVSQMMYDRLQNEREYLDLEVESDTIKTPIHYYVDGDMNNLLKVEKIDKLNFFYSKENFIKKVIGDNNGEVILKYQDDIRKYDNVEIKTLMLKKLLLFKFNKLCAIIFYSTLISINEEVGGNVDDKDTEKRYFVDDFRIYSLY